MNFRSYENTRAVVEASLKKLNIGYLDLVLLHWPFGHYYAAWRELEKLCQEGKIRAIGVSNFDPSRLIDLMEFNRIPPAVNQIETHLLCQRRTEHEWLEKKNRSGTWPTPHWVRAGKTTCFCTRQRLESQKRMEKQLRRLRCGFSCRAA